MSNSLNQNKKSPRIAFFRGVDFNKPIGSSDWRISLFLPDYGFDVWVMGRGKRIPINQPRIHLVSINSSRIPLLSGILMGFYYATQALRHDVDIIICNPGFFFSAIFLKILRPKIKVILDIRSTPVEASKITLYLFKLYFDLIFLSKSYDAVSAITKDMLNELDLQYHFSGRVPIIVWGSGYDDDIFLPQASQPIQPISVITDHKIVLMFHGSISPNRGLDQVIRSLQLLKIQGVNDVLLVIIGKGQAERKLRNMVKENAAEDQVSFLPPMPYTELPKFITCADIGIDLLPDLPWWRNQSPLKIFEYLGMGKPVLATDIPCHRGISESVILIPHNSPELIARAIIEYRGLSQEKKSFLSEVALRDARKYTWRSKAQTLSNFIKQEIIG